MCFALGNTYNYTQGTNPYTLESHGTTITYTSLNMTKLEISSICAGSEHLTVYKSALD